MAEDEEQTRLLQQMLAALQRSSGDTNTKEVKDAKKALADYNLTLIRAKRLETDRQNVVTTGVRLTKQAVLGTSKFVQATAAAAGAIRENREDFTSLNGSIALVGNGMQMASKTVGALGDAAGDALKGIPFIGPALGGVVSAASKVTAALGQAAGEIVKTIGPMLTAELQRASTAYRKAGDVGALGAEGLTGLANQAIKAGLSFNSFAGVINKTGPQLTFALGNSADAAQTLANTSKDMQPFRRGLIALGVGVEQQNELTANYIGLQQRLNRGQAKDSGALAAGSKNYIQQLTELAKLTGKSVTEQQKELDEQTRHVRQGAALREVERKLGGEAGQKASAAIQGVSAVLAKAAPTLSAGFSDALGGNFASEAGKNFYRATGEEGKAIMSQLKAGTISRESALAGIQEAAAKRYASLGGDKFAMTAGNTGTVIEAILVDLQSLTFGAKFSDQIGKIEESTKKTMSTTDKTTNSMINAQESMIKSAKALDELALQTSLPLAAASIEKFTDYTVTASKKMLAYAKAFSEGGMDAVTAQLKKDVMDKNIDPNASALDKQDTRNTNAMGAGAKFSNFLSKALGENLVGVFNESAAKAIKERRVAQQTVQQQNKLGDKADVGEAYTKQYGSQMGDAKKLIDRQRAMRYGGTANYNPLKTAGPVDKLTGADLGSAVTQNLGTTPTTTNAGTATAGQNQTVGSDALLTGIYGELQTNNALQKKILQGVRH